MLHTGGAWPRRLRHHCGRSSTRVFLTHTVRLSQWPHSLVFLFIYLVHVVDVLTYPCFVCVYPRVTSGALSSSPPLPPLPLSRTLHAGYPLARLHHTHSSCLSCPSCPPNSTDPPSPGPLLAETQTLPATLGMTRSLSSEMICIVI